MDAEWTEECILTQSTQSKEYRLPTQKYQEKKNKTVLNASQNSKVKQTCKKKFKLTDNILALYSTPVERKIPVMRARSVERARRHSYVEGRPWLANVSGQDTDPNCSALQFSSNLVNDYIQRSGDHHSVSCPLVRKSPIDGHALEDEQCASELNIKIKTLKELRPCHSRFTKEISFKPGEALKVNGMTLRERLKIGLTPFNNFTKPVRNIKRNWAPKHWWKYLNEKINKNSTPSNAVTPKFANKLCKLCQLDPEHQGLVKPLGKDILHIDLKRLTQVRSKDWSSYGHYTRIHKLRYTKRCTNLRDDKEHQVDVDEDYLSVDVDSLMKVYEQKKDSEVESGNLTASLDGEVVQNGSRKYVFPWVKSDSNGDCHHSSNEVISSSANSSTLSDGYARLQRPNTTTLRSCVSFTSRKTCFTNV